MSTAAFYGLVDQAAGEIAALGPQPKATYSGFVRYPHADETGWQAAMASVGRRFFQRVRDAADGGDAVCQGYIASQTEHLLPEMAETYGDRIDWRWTQSLARAAVEHPRRG